MDSPFGPASRRHGTSITTSSAGRTRYARPPHYMPSFAHGPDAGPVTTNEPNRPAGRRVSSLGTFWTVGGGRIGNRAEPLQGIDVGGSVRLASGSIAPLIDVSFPDKMSKDDKSRQHERRLALALEIDQARRVLPVTECLQLNKHGLLSASGLIAYHNALWSNGRNPNGEPICDR